MAARVAEVLAHRAAAVRGDVLHRRRVGGRGDYGRRVVHRDVAGELVDDLGYRRPLLADRDVEALHVTTVLVDDRVDGDGGLAGLTVADDQLALTTANRNHGVDRLDPRL